MPRDFPKIPRLQTFPREKFFQTTPAAFQQFVPLCYTYVIFLAIKYSNGGLYCSPSSRPQAQGYGNNDIFHNFRDFADIKGEKKRPHRYTSYY